MTDLDVVATDPSALDSLDRQSVVALLERGKTWLQLAVARDAEIPEIVEFKAQAETIRTYTVQKQLGKDAELAAAELVRRAERGIGVAIRRGQAAGTITDKGQRANYAGPHHRQSRDATMSSPSEYLTTGSSRVATYAVTDGVTDEQYETALTTAKAERNLSQSNVIRKIQTQLRRPEVPRRPEVLRRTHRLDSNRIIEQTVMGAANLITPSLMEQVDYDQLDPSKIGEWVSSLSESISALRSLRNRLEKELNHG